MQEQNIQISPTIPKQLGNGTIRLQGSYARLGVCVCPLGRFLSRPESENLHKQGVCPLSAGTFPLPPYVPKRHFVMSSTVFWRLTQTKSSRVLVAHRRANFSQAPGPFPGPAPSDDRRLAVAPVIADSAGLIWIEWFGVLVRRMAVGYTRSKNTERWGGSGRNNCAQVPIGPRWPNGWWSSRFWRTCQSCAGDLCLITAHSLSQPKRVSRFP
jgi:hypothetical protein